jgi:hypothetical protein
MIGVLPRSFLGGVTRSLNISYLKAIPVGTSLYFVKQAFPAPPFHLSLIHVHFYASTLSLTALLFLYRPPRPRLP